MTLTSWTLHPYNEAQWCLKLNVRENWLHINLQVFAVAMGLLVSSCQCSFLGYIWKTNKQTNKKRFGGCFHRNSCGNSTDCEAPIVHKVKVHLSREWKTFQLFKRPTWFGAGAQLRQNRPVIKTVRRGEASKVASYKVTLFLKGFQYRI